MAITSPISLLTPLRTSYELIITQSPDGGFSHDGDLYYGWDTFAVSGSPFGEALLVFDPLQIPKFFGELVLKNAY